MQRFFYSVLILTLTLIMAPDLAARKIKQTLKIKTEKRDANVKISDNDSQQNWVTANENPIIILSDGREVLFSPDSVSFAGYEKEANAKNETVLITNKSEATIYGVKFEIVYTDLQDRMLHSRTVTLPCNLPPRETRKIDFKSWDNQRSYFYYLGNQPRKVATPYKVKIVPLAFVLKD